MVLKYSTVCRMFLQVSSWCELESFLEGFSKSAYGPIPRSALAHCLASLLSKDSSLPWTPDTIMMGAALGVRTNSLVAHNAVEVFFQNSSTWVMPPTPLQSSIASKRKNMRNCCHRFLVI
jgi:hypothetical protein